MMFKMPGGKYMKSIHFLLSIIALVSHVIEGGQSKRQIDSRFPDSGINGIFGEYAFRTIGNSSSSITFDIPLSARSYTLQLYDIVYDVNSSDKADFETLEKSDSSVSTQERLGQGKTKFELKHLRPNTTYDICYASDILPSTCITAKTTSYIEAVKNLAPISKSSSTIRLSWDLPSYYGNTITFNVSAKEGQNIVNSGRTTTDHEITLHGLNPFSIYEICVTTSIAKCITVDMKEPVRSEENTGNGRFFRRDGNRWSFTENHQVVINCESKALCDSNMIGVCSRFENLYKYDDLDSPNGTISNAKDIFDLIPDLELEPQVSYTALILLGRDNKTISVGKYQHFGEIPESKGSVETTAEETWINILWTRNKTHWGKTDLMLNATSGGGELLEGFNKKNYIGCTFEKKFTNLNPGNKYPLMFTEYLSTDKKTPQITPIDISTKQVCLRLSSFEWVEEEFNSNYFIRQPKFKWTLSDNEKHQIDHLTINIMEADGDSSDDKQLPCYSNSNRKEKLCQALCADRKCNGDFYYTLKPATFYRVSASCTHTNSRTKGEEFMSTFKTGQAKPPKGLKLLSVAKNIMWNDRRDLIHFKIDWTKFKNAQRQIGKITKLQAIYSSNVTANFDSEIQTLDNGKDSCIGQMVMNNGLANSINHDVDFGKALEFQLCNLAPVTSYWLRVRLYNMKGFADSDIIKFTTPESGGPVEIVFICMMLVIFCVSTFIIFTADLGNKQTSTGQQTEMKRPEIEESTLYSNPFKLNQLTERAAQMKNDDKVLSAEFNAICKASPNHSTNEARKHPGKNRYINILPFDFSRVILSQTDGTPSSTYINASYIDGYGDKKMKFIASQGPMLSTIADFWRMIWEKNVNTIVMLTQTVEGGKLKCDEYWPPVNTRADWKMLDNGLSLKNVECQTGTKEYYKTRFELSKGKNVQKVDHFHYTTWPDMNSPQTTQELLSFANILRKQAEKDNNPIVVHCSAGVGRTGTLIALLNLMDQIEQIPKKERAESMIDIGKDISKMRHLRCNMVQSRVQLCYLYQCISLFYRNYGAIVSTSGAPSATDTASKGMAVEKKLSGLSLTGRGKKVSVDAYEENEEFTDDEAEDNNDKVKK